MNPHYPLTCQENQFWFMENNFQYRADYVWISKNCKKCPKCKWSIQKNEGCNHMTCRLCHHEFCWLCFQNYNGHNNVICNKLAAEKQMQKQKNLLIMKQVSRKADLMKSQNKFLETQKEKQLQFIHFIKNAKENVKTISAELKDVEKYVEGIESELSNLRKGVELDEILSYQLGE